jgi:hypothetical protein
MANSYEVDFKVLSTDTVEVEADGAFSAVAAAQAASGEDTPIVVTGVRRVRNDGRGTYPVATVRKRD